MKIDKVFIINLKQRTDRKQFMIDQMNSQGIKNYEFFEAIKPSLNDLNKWNPEFCSHQSNICGGNKTKYDRYRIGSLGCLQSHFEIIKLSLNKGYKNILILEDDTMFLRSINELDKIKNQINNEYDMLYLSGMNKGKKEKVTKNLFKIEGTRTTGSYLITENAMNYFKDNIIGYKKEVDVFYAEELQPKFNCYCLISQLTKQKKSFSDIQGKVVRYKLN